MSKNYLLASSQGSGKSVWLDNLAVKYARAGKKVLIAVPTGNLAMDHQKRIIKQGEKPYVLMSHKNLFGKLNPGFTCPYAYEIQSLSKLGVSNGCLKKEYCKNCDNEQVCPFPRQYARMLEVDSKIFICQHAHFTTTEIAKYLKQMQFDIMFIDEEFISSLLVHVKPTQLEKTLLKQFVGKVEWAERLYEWLCNGGYPKGFINAFEGELVSIKKYFEQHKAPWNIPEYIRLFKPENYMDKGIGLYIFHPLIDVPVRVFTDATPPKEMLEIVLDTKDITTIGDNYVVDYQSLNKDSKIIQTVDGWVTKTKLQAPLDDQGLPTFGNMYKILDMIAKKAITVHPDKKILVTTYKQWRDKAHDWFTVNYPELLPRLDVNWMVAGSNAWEDFDVQFLVCGVYQNAKQMYTDVYKLKVIANYWNRQKGRPIVQNPYPFGISLKSNIDREPKKLKRLLKVYNEGRVSESPHFTCTVPTDYYFKIVEDLMIAKTQQAIRLRFKDSKPKTVYVLSNFFLPGFIITDNVMTEELYC